MNRLYNCTNPVSLEGVQCVRVMCVMKGGNTGKYITNLGQVEGNNIYKGLPRNVSIIFEVMLDVNDILNIYMRKLSTNL